VEHQVDAPEGEENSSHNEAYDGGGGSTELVYGEGGKAVIVGFYITIYKKLNRALPIMVVRNLNYDSTNDIFCEVASISSPNPLNYIHISIISYTRKKGRNMLV
jgi:hypothetical protein